MGYLSDHLRATGKNWADCPELYPYAMVVRYVMRDPWMYPNPDDAIALAIKVQLPDVENWQQSVIRPDGNRRHYEGLREIKLRFYTEADRNIAKDALLSVGYEIFIREVTFMNPPDLVDRGEVAP